MMSNNKVICPECKGNGFVMRYLYDAKPSYHDCTKCRNQGELRESDLNPYHVYNYQKTWWSELVYKISRLLGL